MKDAKDSVGLFTEAEKNYMHAEFIEGNRINQERFNRNNENDPFLDNMLDTMQNSMLKNAETKSVILAPFNSTKSDMNLNAGSSNWSMPSEIKDNLLDRNVIIFSQKVREIDKQYEVNNNQELDNGVYHDYWQKEEEKNENADSL
jgi:hypothetical protein